MSKSVSLSVSMSVSISVSVSISMSTSVFMYMCEFCILISTNNFPRLFCIANRYCTVISIASIGVTVVNVSLQHWFVLEKPVDKFQSCFCCQRITFSTYSPKDGRQRTTFSASNPDGSQRILSALFDPFKRSNQRKLFFSSNFFSSASVMSRFWRNSPTHTSSRYPNTSVILFLNK